MSPGCSRSWSCAIGCRRWCWPTRPASCGPALRCRLRLGSGFPQGGAMQRVHAALAHLFAGLLVVQFFLAGLGAFKTVHDKKFNDSNFDPHAVLGDILVLLALIIAGIALVGRWSQFVTRVSLLLFGLMVIQSLL